VIPTAARRVVSLLPAATEMVAALGAESWLVGITHECDHPARVAGVVPRVTTTPVDRIAPAEGNNEAARIDAQVRAIASTGDPMFTLDAARVAALAPDLILTQALCDVCAVDERDVRAIAATITPRPEIVTLGGTTLDGVMDDVARVAAALGLADEGEELLAGLRVRLRTVQRRIAMRGGTAPRVAVIEWTDPLYIAGHWTPDLVARAGGVDAVARAGEHSTVRPMAVVRDASPDLLVFAPCGYSAPQAAIEAAAVLRRPEWAWARSLPAWAVDANALFTRPGPRVVDGVETLAAIFHPALFAAPRADCAVFVHPAPR